MNATKFASPQLRTELARLTRELNGGSIDENAIRSLFILLREHTAGGSLTREIGDFIAHAERNRGIAHSLIEPTFNQILSHFRGEAPKPKFEAIKFEVIIEDLNKHLDSLGIEEIREHASLDAALTPFLSLQGSRVAISKEIVLPLSVAVRERHISIVCHCGAVEGRTVVFPVFEMPNYGKFSNFVHPDPYDERYPLLRSQQVDGRRQLYFEAVPLVIDMRNKKK